MSTPIHSTRHNNLRFEFNGYSLVRSVNIHTVNDHDELPRPV